MTHLRRLLPHLAGRRGRLALGMLCLLAATALALAVPWVLRFAVDDLARGLSRGKLQLYSGLIVGLVLAKGAFGCLVRTLVIGAGREIERDLRNEVFAHLTRLSARDSQRWRVGDVMSRATSDVTVVGKALGPGIAQAAGALAISLGAVALMVRISPGLVAVGLVPLVLAPTLVRRLGRKIHDRSKAVQAQLATVSALVQESLSGARVVRAYARETHESGRFEQANRELVRRNDSLIRVSGSSYSGIWLLMGLGAVVVLWLAGVMVVRGAITLGQFVAFAGYLSMLQFPMLTLGGLVNMFERAEASMGRLAEILDTVPEIRDEDPDPVPALRGELEVRNLTFSHGGPPVLEQISLKVPAGGSLAIVGPSGCGKSTLVSLLARLFDPPPGTVFVDGRDVRRIPLAVLREAIGFVPQETLLFSMTVRENVAFGLAAEGPEAAARAERAAEVAQLAKDGGGFPARYETPVGERGVTLSGGQAQRTALARALATDPRILVLDDAFSSVDTETEAEILTGLREAMANRTTLLVSHRVSTVREAQSIVVLRDGRIAEQGTHEELLARGGFYAALYRRQLLQDEIEATA